MLSQREMLQPPHKRSRLPLVSGDNVAPITLPNGSRIQGNDTTQLEVGFFDLGRKKACRQVPETHVCVCGVWGGGWGGLG